MPFKKGQSGNPGGRTKQDKDVVTSSFRSIVKLLPIADQKLAWCLQSDDPAIVLKAVQAIHDRVHGKAKQALEVSGEGGGAVIIKFTEK